MIYILILLPVFTIAIALIIRTKLRERSNNAFSMERTGTVVKLQQEPPFAAVGETEPEFALDPVIKGASPYSILIVDDQPAIRMLLRELFEIEGITVYEAPHGRTAIEQVRKNRIDFILLDLKMPDMDGIEALKEIRTFDNNVKVAMITAYGDPDKLETAKRLGTLAFFTKPFDIEYVKSFVMSKLRPDEKEEGEYTR